MEAGCGDDIDPFGCGGLEFAREPRHTQFGCARLTLAFPKLFSLICSARRAPFSFSGEIVEAQTINIAAIDPAGLAKSVKRLAQILHDCVHEGASVGFVIPFDRSAARAYWLDRVAAPHAAGAKLVLIATLGDDIAGTAQLDLDSMPSKRHHAEVSKVLVDPAFRRAGVARALMREIERHATREGRWLLTLDTAGDAAEALYRSLGYIFVGAIPNYARNAFEDSYDATRLMYKDLRGG
jgi:ribosomal protein S18 acetylase RimI-like enzyme